MDEAYKSSATLTCTEKSRTLLNKENTMTQHTENAMSRLDARIPLSVRETIDRAAAMQGRTRTDFLIEAALEKAEKVIAEQAVIRLTMRDQEMLAKALLEGEVAEATSFVKDLASEYSARVTNT